MCVCMWGGGTQGLGLECGLEELRRLGEDCAGYRTHTGGEGYQYDGNLFEDGCLVKTVAVRVEPKLITLVF